MLNISFSGDLWAQVLGTPNALYSALNTVKNIAYSLFVHHTVRMSQLFYLVLKLGYSVLTLTCSADEAFHRVFV